MSASTGRTTYADLMGDAAHHVAVAVVALSRERFLDAGTARATVESYWQLLAALHQHAWQLAGGSRRLDGVTASASPDPGDAAAVRFIDSLAATARHPPTWDTTPDGTVAQAWSTAAMSVRTASDLLSTHRDSGGFWRTPEAALLDEPRARADGLAGLANLAGSVLAAERDLGLRCGQAAVPWKEVGRRLPDLEPARLAARDLARGAGHSAGEGSVLLELEVARPRIRTDDPLVELGDRICRLRQTAWQLTHAPHVGMQCLTDYAAAGVIVHTHVGTHLTGGVSGEVADFSDHSVTRRVHQGRAAWALAHLEARQLRTAAPGLAVVRTDLLAVRDLCQRLLPLSPAASGEDTARDPRRVGALVNGCVQAFADIAGWNAFVVDNLAGRGQLYVSGHLLTGDQVTDDPSLVVAKLRGNFVPAPGEQIRPLAQAYAAARAVAPASSWNRAAAPGPGRDRVPSVTA